MPLFPASATEGAVHRAVCTMQSLWERPGSRQQPSSPTASSKLPGRCIELQACRSFLSPSSLIRLRITTTEHFGRKPQKPSGNAKRFCCAAGWLAKSLTIEPCTPANRNRRQRSSDGSISTRDHQTVSPMLRTSMNRTERSTDALTCILPRMDRCSAL